MRGDRKRGEWSSTVVVLIVIVAGYAAAYHFTAFTSTDMPGSRCYRSKEVAIVFAPAALIEAQVTGEPVGLYYSDEPRDWWAGAYGAWPVYQPAPP